MYHTVEYLLYYIYCKEAGTGVGALPCGTIPYYRWVSILGLYKVHSIPFCLLILKSQAFASTIMVPDPGSGVFLIPISGIRKGKKSGSGSGMNNPDHISENLETIYGLKYGTSILKFFDGDPGFGM
jgi:hypothetical protein